MHDYEYPRSAVTVDILLFTGDSADQKILLIRRKNPPFKGHWALPGGFIGMNESLKQAAQRELYEETGFSNVQLTQLGTFGGPDRALHGRVITVAYYGIIDSKRVQILSDSGAGAADARWFPIVHLPPLAFDRAKILGSTIEKLDSGVNN